MVGLDIGSVPVGWLQIYAVQGPCTGTLTLVGMESVNLASVVHLSGLSA